MLNKVSSPGLMSHRGFGAHSPIGIVPEVLAPPASGDVRADVPPGVHNSTMQQVAPFVGSSILPTGQSITVNMNAPNPNLSFKEWVLRGLVGGLGRAAQWPFQLIARGVEACVQATIGVVKVLAIVLLVPTAIWLGLQLQQHMQGQKTIEAGATTLSHDVRRAANEISHGFKDELPANPAGGAGQPPERHPR